MKKIVAIVLSLVMVLGLATTAFAATAGTEDTVEEIVAQTDAKYSAWRYELDEKDEADDEDQTFATYEVVAYALYKGAEAWWTTGVVADEAGDDYDVTVNGVSEFVKVVNVSEADVIIIDGKEITYLADASNYTAWGLKAEKVSFAYCVPEKYECDTLYALSPAGQTCYEDAAGNLYVAAATGMIVNVGGAAVTVAPAGIWDATVDVNDKNVDGNKPATGDVLIYTGHTYQADSKGNSYTEAALEKVYCDACGSTFKYALGGEAKAIMTFGADYAYAGTWGSTNLWVGTETAADTPAVDAGTTTETVESAKTFDAGIAMYVGMSVMAAAGSAVVLKKKD